LLFDFVPRWNVQNSLLQAGGKKCDLWIGFGLSTRVEHIEIKHIVEHQAQIGIRVGVGRDIHVIRTRQFEVCWKFAASEAGLVKALAAFNTAAGHAVVFAEIVISRGLILGEWLAAGLVGSRGEFDGEATFFL